MKNKEQINRIVEKYRPSKLLEKMRKDFGSAEITDFVWRTENGFSEGIAFFHSNGKDIGKYDILVDDEGVKEIRIEIRYPIKFLYSFHPENVARINKCRKMEISYTRDPKGRLYRNDKWYIPVFED